jgi:hypothetical protein
MENHLLPKTKRHELCCPWPLSLSLFGYAVKRKFEAYRAGVPPIGVGPPQGDLPGGVGVAGSPYASNLSSSFSSILNK